MKKISLTLLACLFIISGWSQNNIATFIFEGKQLNVYPYRAKSNNSSTDNMFLKIQENIDIPYCPLTLPDGDYVVFYPKDCHYDKNFRPYYLKGDTDNVAIVFSIKGGKREGQARWFTEYYKGKRCYQTGNYVANEKDGNWNYHDGSDVKTYQYKNGLLDGEVVSIDKSNHQTKVYHFSKGQLHGKYTIKDAKSKDILEFEFNNGALYGNYHLIIHDCIASQLVRLNLDMVRYKSRYDLNELEYNEIDVKGQFYNNLKYGEWEVNTDNRKIKIIYDTLNTRNGYDYSDHYVESERSVTPYREYYGEERMYGEPFTNNIIKNQKLKNDDDFYFIKTNSINDFLEMGYGNYKEYDKKGNLINDNTFYDQSIKYPFILKDINGQVIAKFESEANNLFALEMKTNQGFSRNTYVKTDTGLTYLESFTHESNKFYNSDEWSRSLTYFRYYQLTNLKSITYDSTIYNSSKQSSTYTRCIDVSTGFKFTRSYSNNSVYEADWHIDSLRQQIVYFHKSIFGELTILDTVYLEIGSIKSIFTSPNYTYSYDPTPVRNHTGVVPDSLQLCFIWKGERFTGDIYFRVSDKQLKKKDKLSWEIQEQSSFNFYNHKALQVIIDRSNFAYIFQLSKQQIPPTHLAVYVKEGSVSGELKVSANYSKHKFITLYSAKYKNNIKDGVEENIDLTVYRVSKPRGLIRYLALPFYYAVHKYPKQRIASVKKNYVEYQFYRDGKMEGTGIRKANHDQVEYILNYSKGMLDGPCSKLNEMEMPLLKLNFKNDTLNGIYESFNSKYELTNITNFKNGLPHGKYFKYEYRNLNENEALNNISSNVNFCKERKINTMELEFNNGLLVNRGV